MPSKDPGATAPLRMQDKSAGRLGRPALQDSTRREESRRYSQAEAEGVWKVRQAFRPVCERREKDLKWWPHVITSAQGSLRRR